MAEPGARPRILVTNDDGIHAPGLAVLEEIARALSDDVWVVAPETEQSGAGHSLTLRRPLRPRRLAERRHAVDGTPTDCVLLAVNKLIPPPRPTLVLSGVNRGANLGEDVTYSGTIAAAMEGSLLGIHSIALSQKMGEDETDYDAARGHGAAVVRALMDAPWAPEQLYNINFPARPAAEVRGTAPTLQGRRVAHVNIVEGQDPKNRPYLWIGDYADSAAEAGTDLQAVHDGFISVTPLHLDLTHAESLDALRRVFP